MPHILLASFASMMLLAITGQQIFAILFLVFVAPAVVAFFFALIFLVYDFIQGFRKRG